MPRGGMAARGPPVGVLRSAAHRRAESRFWGVFIIAVHRAFVLGLGARHRGIVELSEGVIRCVTVFACYSSFFFFLEPGDQVIRGNPASRGTETSAEGSCRSALADGVERRSTAVVRGLSVHSRRRPNGSLRPVNRPPPPIRLLSRRRKASGERVGWAI